ncbi:MAG: hypothetical protein EP330_25445 [Deltaproteobacteria bacterium]|nr:MAG: hypothetical protein EP330_25445 [Deltaproteobacteria bacterium]
MTTLTLALALLVPPAHADDPEFLLDAYGARVDLPSGWEGTPGSWTNESFDASAANGALLFFAWGSDFQSPMRKDELKAWGDRLVDKALARKMTKAEVVSSEIRKVGKREVAVFELAVEASAGKGVMFGTAEAVDGHVFHMMVMTGKRKRSAGAKAIDAFIEQLDIQAPPAELGWGGEVSAGGHSAKLPADWRPVLETEVDDFKRHIKDLGVADTKECWTAIRPHGPGDPDVMLACSAPLYLGVVDEYSFAGVDEQVRTTLFGAGASQIAPAAPRDVGDRVGLRYLADLGTRKMALGVVPSENGVMRIWTVTHGEGAGEALDGVLTTSSLAGPHPVELGETVSYYLTYRPFSPMVLGPAALLLLILGGGAAGAAMAMRKKPAFDLDDDEL